MKLLEIFLGIFVALVGLFMICPMLIFYYTIDGIARGVVESVDTVVFGYNVMQSPPTQGDNSDG